MQLVTSLFGYFTFHSAVVWAVGSTNTGPLVNTRNGIVQGKYINVDENRQVSAFLGIPFGQPPIGKLRFADPLPALPWSPTVLKATQYGYACFHQDDTVFPGFRGAEMWNSANKSEDCLHLNIWVSKNTRPMDRLAVMVWIYGGSFYSGSSSLSLYDGTTLADESNVIVASFNYRLGPLGFMPPMGDITSGNAGLHDQVLALKWIRDNIAYFGGDPDRITLFGESAGGVSVGLHTVSPLSRGLFNRVIQQSGTQITPWAYIDLETAKSRMLQVAKTLVCGDSTNDEAYILSCMQSRAASQVFDASWLVAGDFSFPFSPVKGTKSLPDDPEEVLKRGEEAQVDMLIGWNSNEGSYFTVYGFEGYNISTESLLTRY